MYSTTRTSASLTAAWIAAPTPESFRISWLRRKGPRCGGCNSRLGSSSKLRASLGWRCLAIPTFLPSWEPGVSSHNGLAATILHLLKVMEYGSLLKRTAARITPLLAALWMAASAHAQALPALPACPAASQQDQLSITRHAIPSHPFSVVGPRGAVLGQQDGSF